MMIPQWLAIFSCVVTWLMGFLTCGSLIGRGPFWDGIRDGFNYFNPLCWWQSITRRGGPHA